ncbi:MAG: histidinol-phosphate transaminase [Clostridia bacterium]|nr:histidinol-phosphate transaminase [Clostridia bacterium]
MLFSYREETVMFYSKLARSVSPYTAGEQLNDRNYVKLNTNENPYPPSPRAAEAMRAFDADRLKLYPDPEAKALRASIAAAEGVAAKNVFCGNGSDEVLALCFPAFFDPEGKGACFADVTYSFYPVFAEFFRIPTKIIPVKGDYSLDLEEFLQADCQGYFLANPNAPTSLGISRREIENFVKRASDKIVVLDEAYMDFYGESAVPLTEKYENVLVVKTFSKSYSLAGIRCGYAIGNEALIDALFRMKDCFNSYPVDGLCQAICAQAVADKSYHEETVQKVISERERLKGELKSMGLSVLDSKSNFLFVAFEKTGGEFIYRSLKERGVLVRYWNKPKLENYCRITVGTPAQNDALLDALRHILR